MSAQRKQLPCVQMLIERGASIDIRDVQNGATAIHFACSSGDINIAAKLLQYGALLNLRDKNGFTPLEVAKKSRIPELFSLISWNGKTSYYIVDWSLIFCSLWQRIIGCNQTKRC